MKIISQEWLTLWAISTRGWYTEIELKNVVSFIWVKYHFVHIWLLDSPPKYLETGIQVWYHCNYRNGPILRESESPPALALGEFPPNSAICDPHYLQPSVVVKGVQVPTGI